MKNFNEKIQDFVQLPRKIKNDYLEGKLTKNEFDVLIWVWLNANPVNGFYQLSYEGLVQDLRGVINYANARKIISSLRKAQYIHFFNHRGRGGSFSVFPVGFRLTNGKIQTLEYLKSKQQITIQPVIKAQSDIKPHHNFDDINHNLQNQKTILKERFLMAGSVKKITTSYNDNDKNNKIIDRGAISVYNFLPKTYEQEQCLKIAKELGETDMRFLLSCLNKYGFNHIERAWGIFRDLPNNKIDNKPRYFNRLIKNLWTQKNCLT